MRVTTKKLLGGKFFKGIPAVFYQLKIIGTSWECSAIDGAQ